MTNDKLREEVTALLADNVQRGWGVELDPEQALCVLNLIDAKQGKDAEDAARYRFLREYAMAISCADDDTDEGNFSWDCEDTPANALDKRIDAAIKAGTRS